LVVAALGAVALARASRQADDSSSTGPAATGTEDDESPRVLAPGDGTRLARLPVFDASARLLFPSIMVLSLYFLFAGHNQPGGGFVGGLTAGAAISLRYIAGGVTAVRTTFRLRPWVILGGGLAISTVTAVVPLLTGNDVLEHGVVEGDLPWL